MTVKNKILLIDPQEVSRAHLKAILGTDHDVIVAATGGDALALLETQSPDLILLDLEMPDIRGAALCARLKERTNIPVIILSSNECKENIIEGLYAGAEDYLAKPLIESELLARVDAHLRTRNYYADLHHNDLMMLLELTEIVSVTRNPAKILDTIVAKMSKAIDVSRCSIMNINDDGELVVKASSDLEKNREITLDLRKYPEFVEALTTRKPVVIQDISTHPLMAPVRDQVKDLTTNSIIVVPIVKKLSVIGTFFLRTTSPLKGSITERVFKLCLAVANIAGNALENAVLFETMYSTKRFLEDVAVRDGLTKLYNHQFFHARLEEEFSRAHRYQLSLSCLFIDIDNFKKLNDTFGHLTGDVVLRQIGRLITNVLRTSDIASRCGGEEFAILLPNTGHDGALELAERLQTKICQVSNRARVTASIGVATYPHHEINSSSDLLHYADQAMYQAKQAGKDCVRCAELAP